jgi:hypothetical protein
MFLSDPDQLVEIFNILPGPVFTLPGLKPNFATFCKEKMFEKLKEKWGVGAGRVSLILVTFALGGSLTGFLARKVMTFLEIEALYLFIPLYIILVTIFWPVMVLLVSLPLGQFFFFRSYIRRIAKKISRK